MNTIESFQDVLAHVGVKGMKWGVRKSRSADRPVSDDAKAASAVRTTAKTSGTAALSNRDLQTAITRMNLEQQYSRLSANNRSPGAKFISNLLGDIGKQQVNRAVNQYANQQLDAAIKKQTASS